ncbi:MAG: FUSC family protein [Perlucidibaca sp.]
MAMPAGDIRSPGLREIPGLLVPFPGRLALTARTALVCVLTALVAVAYGTPEAAISVYMVFFLIRPDRVSGALVPVAMLLLVTMVIALMVVIADSCVDSMPLRVACMTVLSVALLFVTSASKLRPVGAILAMIVGFGLDELGLAPFGEAATRGLLYAWLMVAIPVVVALVVNLPTAPSPRRLAGGQLAVRLRLAARRLIDTGDEAVRVAFDRCLHEGDQQLLGWLRLARLEGGATAADVAALHQAVASATAILLTTDFITREPQAALPAELTRPLAGTLMAMADMLAAGGYPLDISLDLPLMSGLAPEVTLALAELRDAIEGFAEAAEAPADPVATGTPAPRSGFFDADARSNPDHVRYALKTTAAAMFCYLLYQQLDWPGIHTCLITCYMVSLGTTAETVEKLTLRIAGCLLGALLGTLAIVFVVPALTSVIQLLTLVLAGCGLAAWIAVGSPRIAYAGMQVAFAFLLCVLQGAGPGADLTLARDRVIGILLGNLVVYLVFTRIWPVSIAKRIDASLTELAGQWARIARATDKGARRLQVAAALMGQRATQQDIGLIHYEPSWVRPGPDWVAGRRQALAGLGGLAAPLYLGSGHDDGFAAAWHAQAAGRLDEIAGSIRPVDGQGVDD